MDPERRIPAHGSPGEDPGQLTRLHARLLPRLENLAPALIALSGGVDSRLLCTLASQAASIAPSGSAFAAVHLRGPHVLEEDTRQARDCCQTLGLRLFELEFDPCALQGLRHNPPDRCYRCKREMLERMLQLSRKEGFVHVLDGSNASDLTRHRPGLLALEELRGQGVSSPLADAGVTKQQVRVLAKGLGVPQWQQPARPCLLTRFPYDMTISPELLDSVRQAEALLLRGGFREFRLRVAQEGGVVLQLEESELDLWEFQGEAALELLASMGLGEVQLQTTAEVSGWHDR